MPVHLFLTTSPETLPDKQTMKIVVANSPQNFAYIYPAYAIYPRDRYVSQLKDGSVELNTHQKPTTAAGKSSVSAIEPIELLGLPSIHPQPATWPGPADMPLSCS